MVIWNINRKSYAIYRMVTFPMTLTDPKPSIQGHVIFEVEYLKNDACYRYGQSYYRTLETISSLSNGRAYHFQ